MYSAMDTRATVIGVEVAEQFGPHRSEMQRLEEHWKRVWARPAQTKRQIVLRDTQLDATAHAIGVQHSKRKALQRTIRHWMEVAIVGAMLNWLNTPAQQAEMAYEMAYQRERQRGIEALLGANRQTRMNTGLEPGQRYRTRLTGFLA